MGSSRTSVTAQFMDICLTDVLDFLGIGELLLSAMPVSRRWREQAINRRVYWRHLQLTKANPFDMDRVLRSIDLFLLRLSRTRDRPIKIDVTWYDLERFVPHIVQHLSHVEWLYLDGPLSSARAVLDAFRLPRALLLESMSLHFRFDHETAFDATILDIPDLPRDLFASDAPLLTRVFLDNIALLPGSQFPSCLSHVTLLSFGIDEYAGRLPPERRRLLDITQYFPDLRSLSVRGQAVLDDPVFAKAATWNSLTSIHLTSNLCDGRSFPTLPVTDIRRMNMRCVFAYDVIVLANTLSGPISLAIPRRIHPLPADSTFSCVSVVMYMSTIGHPQRRCERWADASLMRLDADFPFAAQAMTAFQHDSFVERIERLELLLENWDRLVGAGFLVRFPALRTLVILLEAGSNRAGACMPTTTSVLACPRLTQLVLKKTRQGVQPRVQAADVAVFAGAALPDTRFPLRLELNETALDGAWEDYPQMFSDCILTRVGLSN